MKRYSIQFLIVIILCITLIELPIPVSNSYVLQSLPLKESIEYVGDDLFDIQIRSSMLASYIPSVSACIIKNNTIIWSQGYGYYDFKGWKQPTIHTIYQVASVSKTVTATALLQLYEQGLFDLDDDVNEYLPFSLRNPNYPDIPITFRMLLSHHASLHDHDEASVSEYFVGEYPLSYVKELLDSNGEAYHPEFWGNYPPGTSGNYSNLGLTIVGYLVEILSGTSLEEYCQNHIFIPLEMHNTSFSMEHLPFENIACSYIRLGRLYLKIPTIDYTFLDPCGGLFTSLNDLSHFVLAHMNNGTYNNIHILNETTIKEMHTIQYPQSNPYYGILYFGLGWLIFKEEFGKVTHGHDGDIEFSHARMRIFDENTTAIMYFFNKGFRPRIFPGIIPSIIEHQGDVIIRKLLYEQADRF